MKISSLFSALSLKQKFSQGVLWNFGSHIILGVSGLTLNLLITNSGGGAGALGVFHLVWAFWTLLSQVSVGGIHYSVLKFISYDQKDLKTNSAIASSGLWLTGLTATIIAVIVFLSRDFAGYVMKSPGVATGLYLIAPGLIFFAVNKVLLNILNGLNHMRSYAIFQSLRYILLLDGVTLITAFQIPTDFFSASLTFAELLLFVILAIYIHHNVIPIGLPNVNLKWMKEHLSFGLKGFLSGALNEVNVKIDVLILGLLTDDKSVGIYAFAATIGDGLSQLSMVVRRSVDPLLGESFASKDKERIERHARKIKMVFMPIMLVIGMIGVAVYPYAIKALITEPGYNYNASLWIFTIWMIGVIINSGYRPFLGIVLQGGRPGKFTLLILILLAVHVLFAFTFIPLMGMYGAATATSSMLVFEAVLIVLFARKLFGIRL